MSSQGGLLVVYTVIPTLLIFLGWSKACWTPRLGQVFFYLDPWTGLLASVHVTSPVCKTGMTLTTLCTPGSHDSIKVDNIFENTFEAVICWSSMCGWLAVSFRDLLQWRAMDRRCLCLPQWLHRRTMSLFGQYLAEWRLLGWDQVPVHQAPLWTKVWEYGWKHWDRQVRPRALPSPTPGPAIYIKHLLVPHHGSEFGFCWVYFFKLVFWKLKTIKKNESTSYILEQNTNLTQNFIIKYA
jgi:hypothetical protein